MNSVAVIIAVYNRRHFLEKALLALQSQSLPIDELIVTDDGSEEEIISAVKRFAEKVRFKITYIRQENRGFRLAKCRNNAIREAQSDYLVFIDQDVVYTRDYLKTFAVNRRRGQFLVAYPVRLTPEQTILLNDEMILEADFNAIITNRQRKKIRSQYLKDGLEHWKGKLLRKNRYKPKLRGGVCGMFRDDLLKVDGYDETYQGWGNEDDDLGRRLYKAGIVGRNPFHRDFPLHLWHEPFHQEGERINRSYYRERKKKIADGDYRAVMGLSNPEPDDSIRVVRLS